MRANFGASLAILSYHVDRRRASVRYNVDGNTLLQDWRKILSLAGIQQVAWNGREIQKGSFHVFTMSLEVPLLRRRFATVSCRKLSHHFIRVLQ